MQASSTTPIDGVPFRIAEPTRIPAGRYYDEEFYRLECEKLWPRVWQMACRLEEIPSVGDWCEYTNLGWSVIVVRTEDGVKAFHNACRHRGVKLASGYGNCSSKGFVCPFHGWRWNSSGANTFVFGRNQFREEDLDPADLALVPCRVELWGGCAFVNFDNDAPSLLDCLGPAAKRMDARNVGELKAEWWRSAVIPANWKLAMEAFMEGYHVMATHPQLHRLTVAEAQIYGPDAPGAEPPPTSSPSAREFVDLTIGFLSPLRTGMGGMVDQFEVEIAESLRDMELPEDAAAGAMAFYGRLNAEITEQGRARGLPVPDLNAVAAQYPFNAVEFFFPNYFLLPMFTAMSAYRVRPLGPETCLFEIWSLAHRPEDEPREPLVAPEPLSHDDPSFPEVPRQDYANLPFQQLGLHSRGFEYMRLSPKVEGMISNYQRVIDGYLAGLDSPTLAKAAGVACDGGLDSPLVDIGF
jgi:phenylpropionate dioxygenase-like ring-hydroxylating dioxygenase large terminal subunit